MASSKTFFKVIIQINNILQALIGPYLENKTKQNKTKNQTPRLNLQNIILETIKKDDKMGISETHDEMERT